MRDLRFAIESTLLRTALRLPAPVQRALLRHPVTADGLVLSREVQLLLALGRLARTPGAETLPLERARAELRRQQLLVGGRQRVGAVRDLVVDGAEGPLAARLYTPTERLGSAPAPTMLYLHGGGWMYGDLESHDPVCRFLAERSGVQVLAPAYRLAPEHPYPAAVEDSRAALRWLLDRAGEVGADPSRLAVGGDSAGAALATSTAVWAAGAGVPLAFQLLIYPGTDFVERSASRRALGEGFILTEQFMTGAEEAYFADAEHKSLPDASVLRRTEFPSGVAPAHVVTAGFDPLRDEGEAYARLLAEHGVEVGTRRYPSMVHGFIHLVGVGREAPSYVQEIAEVLRRALA